MQNQLKCTLCYKYITRAIDVHELLTIYNNQFLLLLLQILLLDKVVDSFWFNTIQFFIIFNFSFLFNIWKGTTNESTLCISIRKLYFYFTLLLTSLRLWKYIHSWMYRYMYLFCRGNWTLYIWFFFKENSLV